MQAEMIICYSDLGRLLRKLELKENGYKKVIFKSVYSERLCCPLPSPLPIFNCVYNIFFYVCILKSKWFCFSHQSDIIIEKINLRKNLPLILIVHYLNVDLPRFLLILLYNRLIKNWGLWSYVCDTYNLIFFIIF